MDAGAAEGQALGMLTPPTELRVKVERRASLLRATASPLHVREAPSVEVTFSAGDDGVWLRSLDDGKARVFSREVVSSHLPLSAIVRLIGDELTLSTPPSEALLASLFQSLLVYVARMSESVPRSCWGRPERDQRIERALQLLDRGLSKYWTVERLARAVGLSRPVFAREFVRMQKLSPMRYLARRRMQVAAHLLRHGDDSLAEVAAQVGYQSEFAFGRAFKQHHGVAPGTYRRQPTLARAGALCLAA